MDTRRIPGWFLVWIGAVFRRYTYPSMNIPVNHIDGMTLDMVNRQQYQSGTAASARGDVGGMGSSGGDE